MKLSLELEYIYIYIGERLLSSLIWERTKLMFCKAIRAEGPWLVESVSMHLSY